MKGFCGAAGVGSCNLEPRAGAQRCRRPFTVVQRHFRRRGSLLDQEPVENPGPVGAECPIADQFGIQTAVVRVVDLFRHQPVQRRADRRFRPVDVDIERRRLAVQDRSGEGRNQ